MYGQPVALIVLFCLSAAGCMSSDAPLSVAADVDQPMVALLWEEPGVAPQVLVAGRVQQQGEEMEITQLHGVLLRLPMDAGVIQLRTDQAQINHAAAGRITLDGPVHFSGVAEGQPLWGRAQSAVFEPRQQEAYLQGVEWVHAGQRIQMRSLQLSQEWRARRVLGLQGHPAPAALLAAQAALPNPLLFPDFDRSHYAQAGMAWYHQEKVLE